MSLLHTFLTKFRQLNEWGKKAFEKEAFELFYEPLKMSWHAQKGV